MHLAFYLMKFPLKYEYVSAFESAPYGSSKGAPTFEVKVKGALEVTIELHLKVRIVVWLLVQKSSQNTSIKGELKEALCDSVEGAPNISLSEAGFVKKKMHLPMHLMVHLTMQSRVHLWV